MINKKYLQDIKEFPLQFGKSLDLYSNIKISGTFSRVVIFGMGGSSLYVELINNHLNETSCKNRLQVCRDYEVPNYVDDNTLCIVASYSGNTEEVLEVLHKLTVKNFKPIVITSGGKLKEIAGKSNLKVFPVPAGIQPRLSIGYFISAVLHILQQIEWVEKSYFQLLNAIGIQISTAIDENFTKGIAANLFNKLPVVYATENVSSIARIAKIKFNENSKSQCAYDTFPELDHNELAGFTNLVTKPFFLIFQSKLTFERNKKRIKIFADTMLKMDLGVMVINMHGDSVLEELIWACYFIDHVSYYLAEAYKTDPEKVPMIEDLKKQMNS